MKKLVVILMALIALVPIMTAQRRVTPAEPVVPSRPATIPDDQRDRISNGALVHRLDANGNEILVDTVTGREFVDSTALKSIPKMQYPLLHSVSFGVNIWDAAMRIFGQKYGLGDISATVSLHNRYFPTFEFGLGTAHDTPSGMNFTFRSPVTPYFRLGADYNIFYNNSSDYQLKAGLYYGLSAFKWGLDDITLNDPYWGENTVFNMAERSCFAGWFEIRLGVKVKIAGPVSLGWNFKFHKLLHTSNTGEGKPMIVPGYGKTSQAITGSFSIFYTLELNKKLTPDVLTEEDGSDFTPPSPETSND